jgi:hypothetical protein
VWVRWPSSAAGVAAVPVLYAAVWTLLGMRAGLLAALGLAACARVLDYGNSLDQPFGRFAKSEPRARQLRALKYR